MCDLQGLSVHALRASAPMGAQEAAVLCAFSALLPIAVYPEGRTALRTCKRRGGPAPVTHAACPRDGGAKRGVAGTTFPLAYSIQTVSCSTVAGNATWQQQFMPLSIAMRCSDTEPFGDDLRCLVLLLKTLGW